MLSIYKLIRLPNLLMIVCTQYLLRYCIIKPELKLLSISTVFSDINFLFLVLSTVFLAAAGYIINDYFDIKTDYLNSPGKNVIGISVDKNRVFISYIIINIAGLALGTYIAIFNDQPELIVIYFLIAGLLWFYSTTYKKQAFIGNIIISIMAGMVPIIVLLFEIPPIYNVYNAYIVKNSLSIDNIKYFIIGYGLFAFLINFIREIVKDTEDFKGDYFDGRNTIPIVLGVTATKVIVLLLTLIMLISVIYVYLRFFILEFLPILYILGTILLPLIIIIYYIIIAKEKQHYKLVSTVLKFIMVAGIMFMLVIKSSAN